jgi:hypothetical protein
LFGGSAQQWSFAIESAVPPLAFQLILDGDADRWGSGGDISHFTEIEPNEKQSFRLEPVILGFTYSPWPCDYRSKGQLLAMDNAPLT